MKKAKSRYNLKREIWQLDASGKIAGRLASQVAVLLMGKHKTDYQPQKDSGDLVAVTNIQKIKFSGKKLEKKNYFYPSGYPGGIRRVPLKKLMAEQPEKLFRQMVKKMLPNNKLKIVRLKRLTIK